MPEAEHPPYTIEIDPAAWDEIMALPQKMQEQIFVAIEGLESDPRPGNSRMLRREWRGYRRMRVGDYRVIYSVQDDILVVVVVKIGNRRDVYE